MEDLPESPEEARVMIRAAYRQLLAARLAVAREIYNLQVTTAADTGEEEPPDHHSYIVGLGRVECAQAERQHAEWSYSNLLQRYAARWGEDEGRDT